MTNAQVQLPVQVLASTGEAADASLCTPVTSELVQHLRTLGTANVAGIVFVLLVCWTLLHRLHIPGVHGSPQVRGLRYRLRDPGEGVAGCRSEVAGDGAWIITDVSPWSLAS